MLHQILTSYRSLSGGERLLILSFLFYGPYINVAGKLRLTEIIILASWFFLVGSAYSKISKSTIIIGLSVFTSLVYFFSYFYLQSSFDESYRRVLTYLVLAVLMYVIFRYQKNHDFVILASLAFSASYVISLFYPSFIPVHSASYFAVPFRLGLGYALAIAFIIFLSYKKISFSGLIFGLFVIAVCALMLESRSLVLVSTITALICIMSKRGLLRISKSLYFVAIAIIFSCVYLFFSNIHLLIELLGLQENELFYKTYLQGSSDIGLIWSARPDTYTALYVISKFPLLGLGAGNVTDDVYSFYRAAEVSMILDGELHSAVLESKLRSEWVIGIPSHSLIFGAWADAGILAALFWIFLTSIFLLSIRLSGYCYNNFTCFYVFSNVYFIYNIFLSPGPERIPISIGILVCLNSFFYFKPVKSQHSKITTSYEKNIVSFPSR